MKPGWPPVRFSIVFSDQLNALPRVGIQLRMNTPIPMLLVAIVAMPLLTGCRDQKSESMQRTDAATAPAADVATTDTPWAVPPQVVINKHSMLFTSAGARLSGTLYYPEGREKLAAVIVFHGAAEPSQDAELYTHLKQMLPPLGIAVFVFDRRGTGQSNGGERGMQDFDMLSDDGVAAFQMLAQYARIVPKRIGFWGLCQGGWLTLLAANKEPRAAFAVSVSAPMVKADVQMIFASANILHTHGYPQSVIDQAIATRRAIDGYVRGKVDRATVERMLDEAARQPWFRQIYLGRNMIEPNSSWRQQIESDPMRSLDESRAPTLLIFGEEDMWIPVSETIEVLKASGSQRGHLTVRVISGASHEMMLGVDPKDAMDPALFSTFAPNAPEYFGLLSTWLAEHGIGTSELPEVERKSRQD
jgi:alpha-beta hydrolase superfamily lysophospholipase